MALTPDTILRTDDLVGDVFLTFLDGSTRHIQGVALVENLIATPMGVPGTPMILADLTVVVSNTPSVDVNVVTDGYHSPVTKYVTPGSAEASAVISSTPTDLLELRVFLDPTVLLDRWVMLFDASSLPADTAVPLWRAFIRGGSSISESWGVALTELPGLTFPSNGIVAAISSTPNTLTVTGAEAYFQAISLS